MSKNPVIFCVELKIPYQQLLIFLSLINTFTHFFKKTINSYSVYTHRGVNLNGFKTKRSCFYILILFSS